MLNEAQKSKLMQLLKELVKMNYGHGKRIVALLMEATEDQRAQAKATVKDQAQTLVDRAKEAKDAKLGDRKCGTTACACPPEGLHCEDEPLDSTKLAEATAPEASVVPERPADSL